MARKRADQLIASLKKIKDKREAVETGFAAIGNIEAEIDTLRQEKHAIRQHIRELEGTPPAKDNPLTRARIGKTGEPGEVLS
jgi:cell division protein FtsB